MGELGVALLCFFAITTPVLGNSTVSPLTEAPCEEALSVPMYYARAFPNGSVSDPVDEILYPPGTYWVDYREDPHVPWKYRGCPCKLPQPCIRKCCQKGEGLTRKGMCEPTDMYLFNPNVTDDAGMVVEDWNFGLLYGLPCKGKILLDPFMFPDDVSYIRASDGRLILPKKNNRVVEPTDFCVDYVEEVGDYMIKVCDRASPSPSTSQMEVSWIVYVCSVAMLLSTLFLLATFFVYALIPELRNIHGKSLMCHVSCLVMGYVFLSLVQLAGKKLATNNCVASAFVIQFSFLATFFWINIMCIDIYLKFRDIRNTALLSREEEDRKFLYYSAYAWGSPFLILLVTLIMDFAPGVPDSFIKPGFGKDRCWFSSKLATLAYFYGPVAVILLCNIVLFIITAIKIARIKRETVILMDAESRRHDEIQDSNRQRFYIYLKLFIVMGVNWMTEVISWAVGGPGYFWFLTDIGNTLQGFFIFVILVWKDRIRRLLLQKLRPHPAVTNRRQGDPIKTLWYSVYSEKVSYDS